MNHARPNNHLLLNTGLIFLAWTLYGVFFASQAYLRQVYLGRPGGWQSALVVWLVCAYAWAVLTQPVLWLYKRFPFTRENWLRFLSVHIPAAAFFSLAHLAIYTSVGQIVGANSYTWLQNYQYIIVEEFHVDVIIYFSILGINYGYNYFFRKPETTGNISPSISSIFESEKPVYPERLTVKMNGRIMLVDVNRIEQVTSEGNYVKLHTRDKTYLLRETMNAMEQKLDPSEFVRLRRSTIVRIALIAEFHPLFNSEFEVVLKTGAKHSSSRRYRKNLESLLKH